MHACVCVCDSLSFFFYFVCASNMTLSTLSLLALHCFSSYKSSNLLFVSDICKMLHALWNALFYVFVCIGNVAGSYSSCNFPHIISNM